MSVQATFADTLVDEWVRAGVTEAVVCPGSRSTPLALALAGRSEVRLHVKLDERSAAFYAIGLSLATGVPTVVCTTSGTAAAELHPAVVEAHQGRVPLIVCTADRPPELHDVGASQTIDQIGLFTTATRWACAPGVPEPDQCASWRPLGMRAFAEACWGPLGPGPVHLNLAFRDPLIGDAGPLPPGVGPALVRPDPPTLPLAGPLAGRGIIVAGGGATQHPARLLELSRRLRWPLLADPRSGCRVDGTIAAADAIVRTGPPLAEAVVLLGTPWLSKEVADYVGRCAAEGAHVAAVDPWGQWTDPSHVVSEFYRSDGDAWVEAAWRDDANAASDLDWLPLWQSMEVAAQGAIDGALGHDLSEPMVARVLFRRAALLDAGIMVSASMPMRDLEWFAQALPTPPVVRSNRGANGIDGVVSTALGIAATGRRTFALLGDLAFLHDVSGLVNFSDQPCTFVVMDNGGGGIFSFLPQAAAVET
ncbi:MAG TPA: 2-succinyl-5-enolpyruvyl-6-hydroxy-3-cyclohexene-1-carboxylic-acid synthase, partial [Acidimicrobiales bacterium]|nr:2-succinyl-5-enolpyruvyl-6-hydroxy-3-cyclohexene-1-carboxylic-acid synthase [Acidimicrobiales bacterium]